VIIGIGTDLTEIARIRKLLDEPAMGLHFMQRVLTPTELETAETRQGRKPEYVAGRFAVKEACGEGAGVRHWLAGRVSGHRGYPRCRRSARMPGVIGGAGTLRTGARRGAPPPEHHPQRNHCRRLRRGGASLMPTAQQPPALSVAERVCRRSATTAGAFAVAEVSPDSINVKEPLAV